MWATVPLRFVSSFLYIVLILIIFRAIKFRNYHLKNAVFRKNRYTWLYWHTMYHSVLLLHLVFFRWFMKEWYMCFFSFDKYCHFVMLILLVRFLLFQHESLSLFFYQLPSFILFSKMSSELENSHIFYLLKLTKW